jgi:hypothetical protein
MFGQRQRSSQPRHITYPLIFNVTYHNVELALKPSPPKHAAAVWLSSQVSISKLTVQRQIRKYLNETRLFMALLSSFRQI